MKELFVKLAWGLLHNVKISLAVLIAIGIFLTPAVTSTIGFVQNVLANARRLDEHDKKFEKLDMVDEKLNLLMIESGISKHRIETIENHYLKKGE